MAKDIVAKFGGTSLADGAQFWKVINIIQTDPRRRYIVVSAPGKRHPRDDKVTDLLYQFHDQPDERVAHRLLKQIQDRFAEIAEGLNVPEFDPIRATDGLWEARLDPAQRAFVASRGEYLSARILAQVLGYRFVDAAEFIRFDTRGIYREKATFRLRHIVDAGSDKGVVIPGFYGATSRGSIFTFSRGGSDLTGSIVASLLGAEIYENWTDVLGIRAADPRIVPDAKPIDVVTFEEIRELSYLGASVLHDEVIFPLIRSCTPLHLRCTEQPEKAGTLVVPNELAPACVRGAVTGIAGRKGFALITVRKALMNREVGFYRRLSGVFSYYGVSIEQIPGGVDVLTVAVPDDALDGKLAKIVGLIAERCRTDSIEIHRDIALICIVGRGIAGVPGISGRALTAIGASGICERVISRPASDMSILIGVDAADFTQSVHALYREFA